MGAASAIDSDRGVTTQWKEKSLVLEMIEACAVVSVLLGRGEEGTTEEGGCWVLIFRFNCEEFSFSFFLSIFLVWREKRANRETLN